MTSGATVVTGKSHSPVKGIADALRRTARGGEIGRSTAAVGIAVGAKGAPDAISPIEALPVVKDRSGEMKGAIGIIRDAKEEPVSRDGAKVRSAR